MKKQLRVYAILILISAVAAGITVLAPLPPSMGTIPVPAIPKPLLMLANFGLILVIYGLLGLLGFYLSRKNGWPGIYKEGESRKNLFTKPLLLGALCGIFIIAGAKFFQSFFGLGALPHPAFPYSITASFSAGICEELIMRLLLMSFWAWLLNLIFKRFGKKHITDWVAIIIAALVFGIGHLIGPMYIAGYSSLSQVPVAFIIELLVLNAPIGILAGWSMIKYGFVAAVGIHFWTDIVWHVVYGLF